MAAAVEAGEEGQVTRQAGLLVGSAGRAADVTDSMWWGVMERVPVWGDDLQAVAAISSSLDSAAEGALVPLLARLLEVEQVAVDGRLDTRLMKDLQRPTRDAAAALERAADRVDALRPADYVGPISAAAEDWLTAVDLAARGSSDAAAALSVLPRMVGADSPQRILLVFENNAEIRATGGLPGAWTLIEAEGGRLRVLRQGSGGALDGADAEPVATTTEERALYGPQLGLYFRDATMTPDFPRAASLMRQRWEAVVGERLDGIVSTDVVSVSYLLEGLGQIRASGVAVDADNVVSGLLNGIYESLPPSQQDDAFAQVARGIVERLTAGDAESPLDLLLGVGRAASEERVRVAWFDQEISSELAGTGLSGALSTRSARDPVVDVTLNDATGSKMSYFLRYDVDVAGVDCGGGRQRLEGVLRARQTVPVAEARTFSSYVTGGGRYGVPPGSQVVQARVFGPVGGTIRDVLVNGAPLDPALAAPTLFQGRPVVTLALQPDRPGGTELTWVMVTGPEQTGSLRLRVTPGVQPGTQSRLVPSAC